MVRAKIMRVRVSLMIQDDQILIEKKRREFSIIRQNGKVAQKRRRKRKSDEMKWSQMVHKD